MLKVFSIFLIIFVSINGLCILILYLIPIECPRIVSREQWGAVPPKNDSGSIAKVPWVVIHHSATINCTTEAACERLMRSIQNFHMETNDWDDIGYNFMVGENGAVYTGRGWTTQGAHTVGFNSRSIGIAFIGTFIDKIPNVAARAAARQLIQCGVSLAHIHPQYNIIGHRQAALTECPGESLFHEISNWPRFEPNP
uniref:Peptidoglycan-recognition protein n=1 Tax=Corethrella appendiculata TaxID=1370023 RepID=U5EZQ9_9DIPT